MERKKKKLLIVIDMQNDFIDGALANPAAQTIVDPISEKIKSWEGDVWFTRDTHDCDYINTQEGKFLPVPHCIAFTEGWHIHKKLIASVKPLSIRIIDKHSFGEKNWKGYMDIYGNDRYDEIYLCGTCTDICVVSNALILKATFPEIPIKCYANLCAGVTPEKHAAALEVMRSCQVEVLDE